MNLTMTCRAYRQRFPSIFEHDSFPLTLPGKVFQPLHLMNLHLIGVFSAEFTGFSAKFRRQTIWLIVPFVSRQDIRLRNIWPVFPHKWPVEKYAFLHTAFGRVDNRKPTVSIISLFDFACGGTIFVGKRFQHAVVRNRARSVVWVILVFSAERVRFSFSLRNTAKSTFIASASSLLPMMPTIKSSA